MTRIFHHFYYSILKFTWANYSNLEIKFHFLKQKFVTRIFHHFYYSILKFTWANYSNLEIKFHFLKQKFVTRIFHHFYHSFLKLIVGEFYTNLRRIKFSTFQLLGWQLSNCGFCH